MRFWDAHSLSRLRLVRTWSMVSGEPPPSAAVALHLTPWPSQLMTQWWRRPQRWRAPLVSTVPPLVRVGSRTARLRCGQRREGHRWRPPCVTHSEGCSAAAWLAHVHREGLRVCPCHHCVVCPSPVPFRPAATPPRRVMSCRTGAWRRSSPSRGRTRHACPSREPRGGQPSPWRE